MKKPRSPPGTATTRRMRRSPGRSRSTSASETRLARPKPRRAQEPTDIGEPSLTRRNMYSVRSGRGGDGVAELGDRPVPPPAEQVGDRRQHVGPGREPADEEVPHDVPRPRGVLAHGYSPFFTRRSRKATRAATPITADAAMLSSEPGRTPAIANRGLAGRPYASGGSWRT